MKTAFYENAEGQTLCYACVTEKRSTSRLLKVAWNVEGHKYCAVCGRAIPVEGAERRR